MIFNKPLIKAIAPLLKSHLISINSLKLVKYYISNLIHPLFNINTDLGVEIPYSFQKEFNHIAIDGSISRATFTGKKKNILLCAQPKSAGLYFTELFSQVFSYRNFRIGFNHRGGSIYFPRAMSLKFCNRNTISHCHNDPDPNTLNIISNLNLKPIVLTRNLPDALVSRRDMLVKDKWAFNICSRNAINKFLQADNEYQMDLIIDLFAASYINFMSSWFELKKDKSLNILFISYKEINQNKIGLLKKTAKWLGENFNQKHSQIIIDKLNAEGGINFNIGKIGRGQTYLNQKQIQRLKELTRKMGGKVSEIF